MPPSILDVSADLGYYRLLGNSEKARWIFQDLPWDSIDARLVPPELVEDIKTAALAEFTTYSATESFMKLFHDDIDFTQWLAVWFYEETKHPLAFIKWLAHVGVKVDNAFVHAGRVIEPMTDSQAEMLASNICSEIAANAVYRILAEAVREPVLAEILRNVARDEMRHSNGFEFYCQKLIATSDDPDRDRLSAMRTIWFLLQPASDGVTQHPVFKTLLKMQLLDGDKVEETYRRSVIARTSKMLDVQATDRDSFYDVYAQLKRRYRSARPAALAVA
jgi:hypothetical protein